MQRRKSSPVAILSIFGYINAMTKKEIIDVTASHVRSLCLGEGSGHDWWHIHRVRQLGLRLAQEEGADPYIVELAILLHDVADWKFRGGDETAGSREATLWLRGLGAEDAVVRHVAEIIAGLSYKGAGVPTPMSTIEGMVVQDADRLDAIGAIGIARAFAYGGHRGRELHSPDVPPEPHGSFDSYKKSTGPTINHFYEKLLLLKDRMNTKGARRIAIERHRTMELFLERFFKEWDGEI